MSRIHGGGLLRFSFLAFITAFVLAQPLTAQSQEPQQTEKKSTQRNDKPSQRERWFYEQRATPHGVIPGDARLKAHQRLEEMRKAERARLGELHMAPTEEYAIAASTTVWTPIGPRPTDTHSAVGFASGRIRAVAANPLNQNEIYIGGAQGGVWRTMDGGVNWTPLTDTQPSLAMGAIAIDATTCSAAPGPPCQTVYAGTGEPGSGNSIYFGAGVLKTTNGGTSWTQLTGVRAAGAPAGPPFFVGPFSVATGGARIDSLVIQPGTLGTSAVLLAGVQILINADTGTSSGVYRSADGGDTWTQVISGAMGTEVAFDPTPGRSNVAYAGLGSINGPTSDPENGIYKSTDDGVTWTKFNNLPSPITTSNHGRTELAVANAPANANGIIYASIASAASASNTLLAVIKSVDGGATWTHLANGTSTNHCNNQCWYDHVVAVHPNDPNVAYMGGAATNFSTGGYLVRTTDGGTNWAGVAIGSAGNQLHVDIQSMGFAFNGAQASQLIVGNDGGVWRADVSAPQAGGTNPLNWINLNQNLELTQFYPSPSFHPADSQIGFGGAQDNSTQRFTGSLQWTDVTCGDGGWTTVDPVNPLNVYVTCQNIDVRRSTNGGTSFTTIDDTNSPIPQSDSGAFIPPFILDNNNPNRLYFGTCRVWQTTNATAATPAGPAWAAISLDLSSTGAAASCPPSTSPITALALAPSNSNVLYAGTFDARIARTDAAGSGVGAVSTWANINGPGLPIPQRAVTWIAVHPTDPNTVYVSYSGFSGNNFPGGVNDTAGHIFRGTVTGSGSTATATWVDISAGLPNIPVNTIVIDPVNPNTLFLATDFGVYFATDANTAAPGWAPLGAGLPNVAVLGMALHGPSRTLRAATHGRSMWDLIVPTTSNFAITNINPSTAQAGAAALTLTVDGLGFTSNSVVRWAGSNRVTTFINANQLTAAITAADVSVAGTFQVTVTDPGQVNPTNARAFTVTPAAPPNDPFAGAISASTNPFTNAQDTTSATSEALDPIPQPTAGCPANFGYPNPGIGRNNTIWYTFTPAQNVTATIDTAGSTYDTVLSVWTGGALGALTQVDCDDDGVAPAGASRLTNLALTAGVTYHFMVAGFDPTVFGPTVFNFTASGPPASADLGVTLGDSPDPVNAGANLMYTATVTNSGPDAANGTVLTNVLPANTAFVSANSTVGTCSNASGTVTCNIGSLNGGANADVMIVVVPGVGAAPTLSNTVSVTSVVSDPNTANNSSTASTTVNLPVADLSVTLTDAPDPILTGNNLTYTAVVSNNGPQGGSGVVLTHVLPAGTTLVSANSTVGGACPLAAGTITCTIGTLNNGASAIVTIVLTPGASAVGTLTGTVNVSGAVNDPNATNNQATATTTVNLSQADLSVSLADAPDPAVTGSNLTYTAVVSNLGPNPSPSTTMTNVLPGTATFVSANVTIGTGSCTHASGTVTCNLGTLAAPGNATVSIVVTPNASGTLSNTVTVSGAVSDPVVANDTASATTTVNPAQADLAVTLTDAPDPVVAGSDVTFTATVNNAGPDPAASVVLTSAVPPTVAFVSAVSSAGTCTLVTGTITCAMGTMNSGANAVVTIIVTPSIAAAGTLSSSVSVTSATTDPNSSNNTAAASTTIILQADLSVVITGNPDPVSAGTNLTYTATVSNAGPQAATGTTLTNVLPASVTFVSAVSTVGTCSNPSGTVTCNIGSLNSGANAVVTIVVVPGVGAAPTLGNTVSVTSTVSDPNNANNSASTSTTVNVPQADVAVTLTEAPDPVLTGNNLTYTAVVTNNGPQAATSVSFAMALPAGTGFTSATATVGGACPLAAGNITCTIGTLNSGATSTVTIIVIPGAAAVGTLNGAGTVTAAVNDSTPANNSAATTTTVNLSQADLSVTVTDSPDPVVASSNITYTAVVNNAGPQPANAVALTYALPANVTFVSGAFTGGTCTSAAGAVTCNLGTMNSTTSVTITLVVTPGPGSVPALNATMNVTSPTPDPSNTNNSANTTTVVTDYTVAASPTTITVTRGQSGTSTITLTAQGGFTGTVNFTCSGLPSLSNCAFAPASVAGGATAVTTTMTITTTAGAMLPPGSRFQWPTPPVLWPLLLVSLALAAATVVAARRHRAWRMAFGVICIVMLAGAMAACGGGGGGGGGTTPPPAPGTPRGTFNVVVTGTSGATVRTATVSLTVN